MRFRSTLLYWLVEVGILGEFLHFVVEVLAFRAFVVVAEDLVLFGLFILSTGPVVDKAFARDSSFLLVATRVVIDGLVAHLESLRLEEC